MSHPPGLYAVGSVAGCPSGTSAAGLSPLGLLPLVALSFMYVIRHVGDVAPNLLKLSWGIHAHRHAPEEASSSQGCLPKQLQPGIAHGWCSKVHEFVGLLMAEKIT